jgi:hypothetical protein
MLAGVGVAFCLAHAAWGAGERKVAHRVLGADRDRVAIVGERGEVDRDTRLVRKLDNGHYLVCHEGDGAVREYDRTGKVVWSLEQHELPGITLAWVTTLQLLPNGHLIIGNTHAGPANPQLIEVTRDKKVVWTFSNFTVFGNGLAAAQVLDVTGKVIR